MKGTPVWKIESLANGPLPNIRGGTSGRKTRMGGTALRMNYLGWHQARQIRGAYVEL